MAINTRPELLFSSAGLRFIFAALTLVGVVAGWAQGPYAEPPIALPDVRITVGRTLQSPWRVALDTEAQSLRVTHAGYPSLAFEIDADGPEDDKHYEGITLVVGETRCEGPLYGNTVSVFSPNHDAGRTERVQVDALDKYLRVRFEGGSYRELSPGGPDLPVYFEASFFVDGSNRLNAVFNGLYYLFPTASGSRVFLTSRGQEVTREFHPDTHKGYEYFEQVVKVEVEDRVYGDFKLEGLVERLQLHAHGAANTELFEIDLDHSFKDRGQKEVLLRFLLAAPLNPALADAAAKP
ncbi:MAG: hypothetical protein KIT83_05830 [Bryobacterales bacterium]|nr:hypothetical protein [Bryobacterales bacterium]